MCILVVHLIIQTRFHFLPESVAVCFVGAILGLVLKLLEHYGVANWQVSVVLLPT